MHFCFLFVTRNKENWHRGYSGINIDDTTRQPTRDTAMNAVLAASQPRSLAASAWQPLRSLSLALLASRGRPFQLASYVLFACTLLLHTN